MKNILIKIAVLLVSFNLVACSSNTRSTNTAVGGVTGAVAGGLAGSLIGAGTGQIVAIGAGAVAGALLGGYVGHSMDSSDTTHAYQAMDNNKPSQTTDWKNERTGAVYKVTPVSKKMTVNGNHNCRKFRAVSVIDGKKQHVYGVACRQADGTWSTIR